MQSPVETCNRLFRSALIVVRRCGEFFEQFT